MSAATLTKNLEALKVVRGLTRELRHIYKKGPLKEHRIYNLMLEQFRQNEVTSKLVCRGEKEGLQAGRTYLCYLNSVRKHQELIDKYKGKGERTTEQAAFMVGLNLPNIEPHCR